MLEITNLVKRYGHNEPVLKGLDLEVDGSSVVSIVGTTRGSDESQCQDDWQQFEHSP